MMSMCPDCGSTRLKGAPLPVIGSFLHLLLPHHRYCCADCKWVGWKHRLRRRGHGWSGTAFSSGAQSAERAMWSLLPAAALALLLGALVARGCDADRGSTQSDEPSVRVVHARPIPYDQTAYAMRRLVD